MFKHVKNKIKKHIYYANMYCNWEVKNILSFIMPILRTVFKNNFNH